LLIDGHGVVRRCYEKLKRDAGGALEEPKLVHNAMRTGLQSLNKALSACPTSHACVVFDFGGKNWRHRLYPEYKANREPSTDEFKQGVRGLRSKVEGVLGVKALAVEHVEADDTIATLVRRWIESGRPAANVTVSATDKDLAWLGAHGVVIHSHFEDGPRDAAWVAGKFGDGITHAQILDYLALVGDKTDNVPGLNGCGPKTAHAWLTQYGTLPALLEKAGEIPGAIGDKLRAGIEAVKLSRTLVSLHTKVQCGVSWRDLLRE
jgi:DNA polymerase-1